MKGILKWNKSFPEFPLVSANRKSPERDCILSVKTTFLINHLFSGMFFLGPSNWPTFVNVLHCLSQWTGQPHPCLPGAAALSGYVCNSKLSCDKKHFKAIKFVYAVKLPVCFDPGLQALAVPGRVPDLAKDRHYSQHKIWICPFFFRDWKSLNIWTKTIPYQLNTSAKGNLRMFHFLIQLNPEKSQIPAPEWCPHGSGHTTIWTMLSSTWCNPWGSSVQDFHDPYGSLLNQGIPWFWLSAFGLDLGCWGKKAKSPQFPVIH